MSLAFPADPAEGLAFLRRHVAAAPFNAFAGYEVVEAEPGRVVIGLAWREDLSQIGGHLHAGVQSGALEVAGGLAVATASAGAIVATSCAVSFVGRAVGVRFLATGLASHAGRRQGFATAELHAEREDGTRRLVATAQLLTVPVAG